MGDAPAWLRRALQDLGQHPAVEVVRVSSFYLTKPWGEPDQQDFVNAVAELHTELAPEDLLDAMLTAEQALGRIRGAVRWGPRNIDLDLLDCDGLTWNSDTLTLPHPLMHLRAFVLAPLLELEPGWVIPGHGSAESCLAALPQQGIKRIG